MEWCDAGSLSDALQDGRLQVRPAQLAASYQLVARTALVSSWLYIAQP